MNGMPDTTQENLRRILDAVDGSTVPSALDVNGIPKDTEALLREIAAALAAGKFGETLNLADLADVTITEPADGDVLTYDSDSGKWINTTASTAST